MKQEHWTTGRSIDRRVSPVLALVLGLSIWGAASALADSRVGNQNSGIKRQSGWREMTPDEARQEFRTEMRWDDQAIYRKCDLTCAYKKANETIAMYAIYQSEIRNLINSAGSNKDSPEDDTKNVANQIRLLYPELAILQEEAKLGDQELIALVDRVVTVQIESAATAVEANRKEMAKMQKTDGLRPRMAPSVPDSGSSAYKDPRFNPELQRAQIPTFARSKKLREVAEKLKPAEEQETAAEVRDKLEAWSKMASDAPDPKNRKLFRSVPRDPQDPDSDTIQVPQMCGNEQCLDEEGAKKELEQYGKQVKAEAREKLLKFQQGQRTAGKPAASGTVTSRDRKLSRAGLQGAYRRARGRLPTMLVSKKGKPLETTGGKDGDEVEFKDGGVGTPAKDQFIGVQPDDLRKLKPTAQ